MKTILVLLLLLTANIAHSAEIFFIEDLNSLKNWKPLYFPQVTKHSNYSIVPDCDRKYLKAQSNASASAIVHKREFNVYRYPMIKWRWRVENIYEKGDANTKAGDDFPLRIYVLFKYDPENAQWYDKARYKSLQLIYGEYPPHSSLSYVWANREHTDKIITNPYNDKSKMVLLQYGTHNVGKWLTQEVNIIEDYKKAFGEDPPGIANVAVMNDSDNTGESSTSYVDYIQVYNPEGAVAE